MSTVGLLARIDALPEVQIGTQIWMSKNYDFGGIYPNGSEANVTDYGRLYTWDEAMAINYPGWHLPTYTEYTTLITYLGGSSVAGGYMKEIGLTYWDTPNTGADNLSGFSGRGAGYYYVGSGYIYFNQYGVFWMRTEYDATKAYASLLHYSSAVTTYLTPDKIHSCSVRLIKD